MFVAIIKRVKLSDPGQFLQRMNQWGYSNGFKN